ncbi:hypothetical protein FSARC_13714 [Fusarium sarcochroum]|uniref:DUF7702 domain-containing protein n=1 Tax=Fusarium sarcochroum TaxID=1208366 RepID=A0A8H4WSD0_9HYPO|nr:hypothetical protein FSARC_13714 [Fusarium sarcochroum]
MHGASEDIPPPSSSDIGLAYADLVIHGVLFPVAIWITWKHGKTGMVCWPIFASYFVMRFIADVYQIVNQHEPEIPGGVSIFTNAGSIACLTLSLIGIIYEANVLIPDRSNRFMNNALLGFTHLVNTAGIGIATYGGSPSAETSDGVASSIINKIGNCLMIFVILIVFAWWLWSTNRILAASTHPNWPAGTVMLLAAGVGIPFQFIRVVHSMTYAFERVPSMDPIMGVFAVKLILIFLTQLAVVLSLVAGGWLSKDPGERSYQGLQRNVSAEPFRATRVAEPYV